LANPAIALIGSDSLLAREVRDLASTAGLPLRLLADEDEQSGALTRVGDEPAVVAALNAAGLSGAAAVILAGSEASSKKALDLLDDPPESPVIDLTHIAEDRPGARLRAPAVEDGSIEEERGDIHVIAHPAAIAIALLLRRLHRNDPVLRAVIQVLMPASEQGAKGVEELQQQTVSLLSFKSLPKAVFDAQLAFSLLPRLGPEAPATLEEAELRIERHLASLLSLEGEGEGAPMPSLRVIQAPVFHGYTFSAWIEFEDAPEFEALESALGTAGIEVRGEDSGPPNNVGQAGQGGITVGAIAPDRNHGSAYWFWFVADNLRIQAENALAVAREFL
jgi:aspartate-semialdehyde dehydrogenase